MGALKELFILGEIRTTVEYLGELLETDAFKVSARASSVRVSVRLVPGRADRDGCLQGGAASGLTLAPNFSPNQENTIDTAWLDGIIAEKSVSVAIDRESAVINAAVFRGWKTIQVTLPPSL